MHKLLSSNIQFYTDLRRNFPAAYQAPVLQATPSKATPNRKASPVKVLISLTAQ